MAELVAARVSCKPRGRKSARSRRAETHWASAWQEETSVPCSRAVAWTAHRRICRDASKARCHSQPLAVALPVATSGCSPRARKAAPWRRAASQARRRASAATSVEYVMRLALEWIGQWSSCCCSLLFLLLFFGGGGGGLQRSIKQFQSLGKRVALKLRAKEEARNPAALRQEPSLQVRSDAFSDTVSIFKCASLARRPMRH